MRGKIAPGCEQRAFAQLLTPKNAVIREAPPIEVTNALRVRGVAPTASPTVTRRDETPLRPETPNAAQRPSAPIPPKIIPTTPITRNRVVVLKIEPQQLTRRFEREPSLSSSEAPTLCVLEQGNKHLKHDVMMTPL